MLSKVFIATSMLFVMLSVSGLPRGASFGSLEVPAAEPERDALEVNFLQGARFFPRKGAGAFRTRRPTCVLKRLYVKVVGLTLGSLREFQIEVRTNSSQLIERGKRKEQETLSNCL